MPQTVTVETKVDGDSQGESEIDKNLDSDFAFAAHAAWQTDKLALVIGGSVNKLSVDGNPILTMSYMGVGANYYFILDQFSPYCYGRIGVGFGTFDKDYIDNDDLKLTGYLLALGLGAKIYLDQSWGLAGEFGYQITSQSDEVKIKDRFGNSEKYEYSFGINFLSITAGFFFYP